MAELAAFEAKLGVSFSDPLRLRQALTHSSYLNENPLEAPECNERLEFLGDAVLGLVISEKLYRDLPQADEGEMTKLRAALVKRDTLARVAAAIGLGDYLYLGRGEESSGGRRKKANLACALEAVIAAVFLDQGPAATEDFILRLFQEELAHALSQGGTTNYKSRLQELLQSRGQSPPVYHLVETSGPDHERRFTIEVRAGNTVLGRGSGKSKKLAETAAARAALEHPRD
ncbi:MAG: ribonuclease III [Dehalococcoidales bacterium]|nr:ribonuclease III [Dehalococcoidales bacterium]